MNRRRRLFAAVLALPVLIATISFISARQFENKYFGEMRWRSIGPYRGGRTKCAAGVPSQPNVFYIGVCNGGVWKTNDYGRTWKPIFDDQPTNSIGAVAVAPSDPNVVYIGSGEGLQRPDLSTGDGIYKSTDAGKTWTHLGLRNGQQIGKIVIDPKDANRLFVAVVGHPYGPNEERGIFRSIDGGQSFQKILYKDENTGGYDLDIDPTNTDIVYATMWEARQGPWENAAWTGTGGGIFKSTDGGNTWRKLTNGLPELIQADIAVAPSNPHRLYASVTPAGIYRSDDGGETWSRAATDNRPASRIGGGDQSVPEVNPKNPDILWIASTVAWKSIDGGKTWTAWRGAPGGDDYQALWVNPNNPDTILMVADQGAVVTVNGGESWSSWYTEPTAQLYHIAADNAFPYRLCSGQQESGSACVSSRGNDGQITFREWHPVGVDEYGYVAPDPLDPDIVYGGRSVSRYDRRTGQVQTVGPRAAPGEQLRTLRTAPVLFSPVDPHTLYFAANTLWKTINGGKSWSKISPDLSRATWELPANIGKYRESAGSQVSQRGVIYTVAPSYLEVNRIWAGTDDGLIHVTIDGGVNWKDVTPTDLKPWAKVSLMDAGHFDPLTAYAAINTIRLDDLRPHIYRTHDSGKTWTHITNGIPDGGTVNVVREDPKRRGLLYAGTEREVFVSFDDGDHWQSLRLNMPASSIRDLIVKDDDLAVATHGRGFWILDDITPLRQLDAGVATADAFLFKPTTAMRVRWNMNTDTPLPPDESNGQNPPEGAIINYYLKAGANGPITLEILDPDNRIVRRYSSADPVTIPDSASAPVPLYWYRPPQLLSPNAGMHRFTWDIHFQALPAGGGGRGAGGGLPMQAIAYNTAPAPGGPWAPPGQYTVRLTVNGKSYTQPITVKLDPRVKTPAVELNQIFSFTRQLYNGAIDMQAALQQMRDIRTQVKTLQQKASDSSAGKVLAEFDKRAAELEDTTATPSGTGTGGRGGNATPAAAAGGRGGGAGASGPWNTLASLAGGLGSLISQLQASEMTPVDATATQVNQRLKELAAVMARWSTFRTVDLPALNAQLKQANLPEIGKAER